ncbi:hypothetical protein KS4_16270 [Poriferisphaera corsica]|uniref:Uncharacterized protein n=1 Tax=Poriferisphaera corsica TaxID=2528020 RepID=A0A517YTM4_9BACT|nr:hypothetical protein [Poriferisphaera corsica]QDU33576.1 hypothetical protein KS4_16270 [Poriferisphaera corsica]
MEQQHQQPEDLLQGYFEWQISTLMLAYDVNDPILDDDEATAEKRRTRIEQEVKHITLAVVPEKFQKNQDLDWPPELLRDITKTTLLRAAGIIQNTEKMGI